MSTRLLPLWRIVAEREITTKLRDKAFLGTTAFTLLLVVAAFVVSAVMEGRAQSYDVAVTSQGASAAVAGAEQILKATSSDTTVDVSVIVPTVDRGFPDALFCSMAMVGERPRRCST